MTKYVACGTLLHGHAHGVAQCRRMWVVHLMCPNLLLRWHRQSAHVEL